jgi:hypothetical protein
MICQRDGCSRPVPPGRRKYCSVECSKIVNRRSAAERSRLRAQAYRRERMVKYAPRNCLSCSSSFMSEGPWNRICPSCGDRNDNFSYSRAHGSALGSTDDDNPAFVELEIETQQDARF